MKFLFLLLVVAACGKHEMPNQKDLADSDGDQIPNALESSEFEKQVANVTPIGLLKARLTIRQGKTAPVDKTLELENNIDLSLFAKDMLVKSLDFLPVDDYFSQYSLLKVINNKESLLFTQSLIPAFLTLEGTDLPLNLSLLSKGKSEFLGSFTKTLALEFSKETLDKILSGEAVLAVSRIQQISFIFQTQDETVKSKTYRVFLDDGVETRIYYVSRNLSFENFLQALKIEKYYLIEEIDLLSTNHVHRMPVWWLRNLNAQDKVLILSDVKALADHYLRTMEFKRIEVSRKNGLAGSRFSLSKGSREKALIKIRGTQTMNIFKEHQEVTKHRVGSPRDAGYMYSCYWHHRNLSHGAQVLVQETLLKSSLKLSVNDAAMADYQLISGEDEVGQFWELKFGEGTRKVDLYLDNLPASTFTQVGMYNRDCGGEQKPVSTSTPVNLEGQISFFLETYVEKI